ncbi:cellulase family glycosylhydrolase [Ulvibacterium sp.]|uniref:cellulase family glycosylhydrolase n=1 Tax=Ulvibacterium sp. TaxID=2665914 RepID=UPI002615A688|nr:cellulase family glycosylhydrolase [Ulvibacterium sp.]
MKKLLIILGFSLGFFYRIYSQPIALHPENPHYFQFRDKPTVLITSGEHYGSVINPDFNFELYLETLHREGFNHTRIFLGDYAEKEGDFCIVRNSLSPDSGKFLAPWMRSTQAGNALGGNRFDLDNWNPEYFERLHQFMNKADNLGIVVEGVLFFEGMNWEYMPMNRKNNINQTTKIDANQYMTLSNGIILEYQKSYVRKLVSELNRYDNLIINIANEPWFSNQEQPGFSSPPRDETKAWIREMSGWIVEEENKLPKKHLLSIDYCNEGRVISDDELTAYWKNISVFNHHYDKNAVSVRLNYHRIPKAFSFNETGLMPTYSNAYRIQGWKYLMCGGSLYNNLDFTFQVGHEDGKGKVEFSCDGYRGCGDPRVRSEISVLASFFKSIDFVKMKPAPEIFVVYYGDKNMYALANHGKQYAIYVEGGKNSWYRLGIPFGKYMVEYIDPVTGIKIQEDMVEHRAGDLRLDGPDYHFDLAIRINLVE